MFQLLLCNFHLVTPAEVEINLFLQKDKQIGCNGTRRVLWQPLITGTCSVEYTIEFRDSTNDTIGIVGNITNTSYCTSDYNNAKSVVMWATYKGKEGNKSNAIFLTPTPKPNTPPSTTASATAAEGIQLFKISNTFNVICYVLLCRRCKIIKCFEILILSSFSVFFLFF